MKIKRIIANQVRLTQTDQIPMATLINQKNLVGLKELFTFGSAEVVQNLSSEFGLRFTGGIYQSGDQIAKILDLSIRERKTTILVEGNSTLIEGIVKELNKLFVEISGNETTEFLNPIIVAEESEIVSQMKFEFAQLLSKSFGKFLTSDLTQKVKIKEADIVIRPKEISFEIDYSLTDDRLKEYNIQLSKKDFVIGTRAGYPLDQRIFYSKAPVVTDTHVKLLENLEKSLE